MRGKALGLRRPGLRLFLYLFIPGLAAFATWMSGILVVSYSTGQLGSRTPSYGFPLPWMTVGYMQGCLLPTPGCYGYDVNWVSLTLDMLLYSALGFAVTVMYLRATRTSLSFPQAARINWRVLKTIMIVILVTVAFEPIVAGALYSQLPCISCPVKESITLDYFQMNSPTNVTLAIRNTGSSTTSLANYEVQDSLGNQWWRIWLPPNETTGTWWSGPTISPNATGTAIITIGSSCGNCTYQGTPGAFGQFNPRSSYTVTVVTSGNYHFTFPITT